MFKILPLFFGYYRFDYAEPESHSFLPFYMMGKETMLDEATKNALKPVHADELLYLFDFGFDLTLDKDIQMREIMVKYWTNFAKYGNPSPVLSDDLAQWLTYSSEKVYSYSCIKYFKLITLQ